MYTHNSAGTLRHTFTGPSFSGVSARGRTRSNFMSYFARHIALYEQSGREGSANNYRQAYRMLARFLEGEKLYPEHFTANWVKRYEQWLLDRSVSPNTVIFHIRYLKAVYNQAVEKGYFRGSHNNPFRRQVIKQIATRKRALTRRTLRQISDLDLSELHPRYALARDLFMFSFYTRGMSFIDMVYLRKSNISDSVLTYRRKKTGQILSMRIEPPLQDIIDRYDNDSPYILPILTRNSSYKAYRQQQRELNKFIRRIGALMNLPEPLTFYVARHSWATLARDCGTPLSVISAGMGHTSERTTRIYLTQLDHNVIDRANRKIINL